MLLIILIMGFVLCMATYIACVRAIDDPIHQQIVAVMLAIIYLVFALIQLSGFQL